jgi:hypothetical protein
MLLCCSETSHAAGIDIGWMFIELTTTVTSYSSMNSTAALGADWGPIGEQRVTNKQDSRGGE